MKNYTQFITLARNGRGCYILDTVKGCPFCTEEQPNGCYDGCYAKQIASRYGFDFSKPVMRDFKDSAHINSIISRIKKIKMPFVRIGEMGDPSFDWDHTMKVCEVISSARKPIVIITKHFNKIPDELLECLSLFNVCVNTSVSALDNPVELERKMNEYYRLKKHCNSVLRIVSCDFNLSNEVGAIMAKTQENLLSIHGSINTVFRPGKNNYFVKNGIINVEEVVFLKQKMLASVAIKNEFIGYCNDCPDMCGIRRN